MEVKNERSIEEIQRLIAHIEKEKSILEKEKEKVLLKENVAFQCERCKKICLYEKKTAEREKKRLCKDCWSEVLVDRKMKELRGLVHGVITEVNIDPWYKMGLKSLSVYKHHMIYELRVTTIGDCNGDAAIEIFDCVKAKEVPVIDQDVKPWQKIRKEIKIN
jgi:hypothetical protein